MSYLVFPRVRVQAANMLAASFLMGGPPVFAAYGLGEALCFHLGGGAKVTGMALIHHNREALGQSFYGVFSPQQRRAAAFTFGKSANGSDYSSKNPHALSLQPVACVHLRVSIIWELEQVAGVMEAREFLHRARLSGGLVTGHGEIVLEDSLETAFDRVGNGYVVTDRRDMLEDKGKNQAELLVEALGAQPSAGEDNTCPQPASATRRSRLSSTAAERVADIHMPLPSLWSAWCNTVPCASGGRKRMRKRLSGVPCGWMIGGAHSCCGKNKRNLRICKEILSWQRK